MLYCERCSAAAEGGVCPICVGTRLRAAQPDDACFLMETGSMWAEMLRDVLGQNGIPCMEKSSIGAGLGVRSGAMFETVRCYVRSADLEKAREIARELFPKERETGEEGE